MRRYAVSCGGCVSRHSNTNLTLIVPVLLTAVHRPAPGTLPLTLTLTLTLTRLRAQSRAVACAACASSAVAHRTASRARLSLLSLAGCALRLTRAHASHAQRPTRAWAASLARTGRSPTVDATSRSSRPRLGRRARVQCPRRLARRITSLPLFPAHVLHTQRWSMHAPHSNARRRRFGRARTAAPNCSSTGVANLIVVLSYLPRAAGQHRAHTRHAQDAC